MKNNPTFSIISVYNNKHILNEYLMSGLKNQSFDDFEIILLDNRFNKFDSASSALNHGGNQAIGDYLIFIHQDVLLPYYYIEKVNTYVQRINNLGVAGAAGVRDTGKCTAQGLNMIQHGEDARDWERGTYIQTQKGRCSR